MKARHRGGQSTVFHRFSPPSLESGTGSGFGGPHNGAKQPGDQTEVAEMDQYPGAGLAQQAGA